jgi:cytoskeleton protein RodZ
MASQSTHDDGPRVGALLRASRLRCGEEAADVAQILHIRLVYIVAIEEGRYDDLPGVAYAVGFIRAYAEHLGLDSEEVVRRFKAETSGLDMSTDLKFLSPIPESGIPRGAILFVGMVVAVLAYGGWYVSSTRDHFLTDLIPPLPERLAALLPTDGATDAKAPPTPPGPDSALAGEAPQSDSLVDSGKPTGPTQTVVESADQTAIPQPVTTSAETERVDSAAESAPPIAVATAPEMAETPESPPIEETPVTEATLSSPAIPVPTESVATDTIVTDTVATIIPLATEATPEAEPTVQAVTELTEVAVPATPERSEEPATGDAPQALPPPPPAVATAVDDLRQPTTPVTPETVAPLESTVDVEQPNPVADTVATTDPSPPETTVGGDSEQVAALTEDTASKPATDAATPMEEGESRILVRARMASWIQVRDDVGNQLLMTRLMRAGDTFNVPDRPGLTLLTGNAGALEILVDGETMPPLGPVGAVRRDVTLDVERLREGTAAVE